MTKKFICFLLAVLTVLSLTACGTEVASSAESSAPEALETFGTPVDPSAQPSAGEIISAGPVPLPSTDPAEGVVTEGDTAPGNSGGQINESETVATTAEPSPSPTKKPTVTKKPAATSPTPTIAPPAPASSATADDATKFIGKTLGEFIAAHGYPQSSDYEYIDEEDPDAGEIGTIVFNGFVVKTKKTADGETITSVTKTGGPTTEPSTAPSTSPSAEASEKPEISPDPEDPMAPTE